MSRYEPYSVLEKYDIQDDRLEDSIRQYCSLLKSCNISVIVVDLNKMFTFHWRNINNQSAIVDEELIADGGKKQFFKCLFNALLADENNYFKIAIVIQLFATSSTYYADDAESLDLYHRIINSIDDPYTIIKAYFEEKNFSNRVLQNKSVMEIVNGKGKGNKIAVVPQIYYGRVDMPSFRETFVSNLFGRNMQSLLEKHATAYSFLEDIFKIPIHECMFIVSDTLFCRYHSTTFNRHTKKLEVRICSLVIHNFTNNDLNVYMKKHKNLATDATPGTTTCTVISQMSEQLDFVRCLDTRSIVVLSDKDKWERGVLYRDKDNFLSNYPS